MNPNEIQQELADLKRSLIDMFGPEDATVRACETKQIYLEIYTYFDRLRMEGTKYEVAIRQASDAFNVSPRTVKRAVKAAKKLVTQ